MSRMAMTMTAMLMLQAGCVVPPMPPTPREPWMETDPGTGREFHLYVPETYDHGRPAPLIVSCHGTWPFDVASDHARELKWFAEQGGCIVVAPSLVATDGIFGDGPTDGMLADERTILSILGALAYRYNVDLANVMITGFSGGGFPTYWVGLRHPEIFSCVVARNCNFSVRNLDGWLPAGEARDTSVLIYWGELDLGPIKVQSHDAVEYLRAQGLAVETAEIPHKGHERQPQVAMEFFRRHWRPARASHPPTSPSAKTPSSP